MRGEASTVWDDAGNALIDISGALWYCNVGYGRAELAEAAAAQMRELASYKTYDGFTSPQTEALAARVAELVPLDGAKVFFTSGGGESIDTAAKLARAYWAAVGKPDKHVVVSRQFAYHGSNAYGTSLGGMAALTDVYGRLVSDVEQVPWDDAEALADAIDRVGCRPGGRVLRRADHRRRRRADPARGLPRPRPGDLRASARCCSSWTR